MGTVLFDNIMSEVTVLFNNIMSEVTVLFDNITHHGGLMKKTIVSIAFLMILFVSGVLSVMSSGEAVDNLTGTGLTHESAASFESELDSRFPLRSRWINLNGLMQRFAGKTADVEKNWYRMSNGQMIYSSSYIDNSRLERYSDSVAELSGYAAECGASLYYVQLPFKVADNSLMPPGVTTYGVRNGDAMVSMLAEKNVNVIDLDRELEKEFVDRSELYFDTDQHWKPYTALWAAQRIYSHLRESEAGWEYDEKKFDSDNFECKTYEDWFLGSIGKKTGELYAGTDDFDLIWPKYRTDYDFTADTATGKDRRSGSFEDVMFRKENLKKDYFNVNTYAAYIGGDYRENKITNRLTENRKKVLILRDSFSCVLFPFMTLDVGEATTLDLRHYRKMSVMDYLKTHDIDIVLICYNPSAFGDKTFNFTGING